MNNHRDFFGVVSNIFIAVAILAVIILGLNKIGLYKLPDAIENFISPPVTDNNKTDVDESKVYESVHFDSGENIVVQKTDISYENARQMLESVVNTGNYRHELSVTRNAVDGASSVKRVVIEKDESMYKADIYSAGGVLLESVLQDGESITVKKYISETETKELTHPAGSFTVNELAGVVTNHENFLSGSYVLEEGDFSVVQGDFGIELEIVFNTVMDSYEQKEVYRINVDFGIVTSARCYENDTLVYDMQTLVLRELN